MKIAEKALANPKNGCLGDALRYLSEGHYFLAAQILASFTGTWQVIEVADYKVAAKRYIELATIGAPELGKALYCCAKLALSVRHPADSFVKDTPEYPLLACSSYLANYSFIEGMQGVGGIALGRCSLNLIKATEVRERGTEDAWRTTILEKASVGRWMMVGALAAAAIKWSKR